MIEGAYPKLINSTVDEIAKDISEQTEQYIVKQLVSLDIDTDVLKKQAMEIQRLNAELNKMYQKGRADAIEECIRITNECCWKDSKMLVELFERMKEERK